MDDPDVGTQPDHLSRQALQVLGVRAPLARLQLARCALQPVMDLLGHIEEARVGWQRMPRRVEAEVAAERYQRTQHLRNAAAEGSGVDMDDARTAQARAQTAKFGALGLAQKFVVPGHAHGRRSDLLESLSPLA